MPCRRTCGSLRLTEREKNRAANEEPNKGYLVSEWRAHWGPLQGWSRHNWSTFRNTFFTPEFMDQGELQLYGVNGPSTTSTGEAVPVGRFHYCTGQEIIDTIDALPEPSRHHLWCTVNKLRAGRTP